MYTKSLLFLSALLLALALLFLPAGASRRLHRLGNAVTSPAEEMAAMGARVAREALGGLPPNFTLEERDRLLKETAEAKAALQSAAAAREKLEAENRTLHALFRHMRANHAYSLVVAEVLRPPEWRAATAEVRIDRGAANGLRPGQAALTTDGLAGVVVEVSARRAVVRLTGDARFTLAGEIPSRQVSGIVESDGQGGLRMTSPMGAGYANVLHGDQVFTTDLAGEEMQPGLLIGTVTHVSTAADGTPVYGIAPPCPADAATGLPSGRFLMVALPALQ